LPLQISAIQLRRNTRKEGEGIRDVGKSTKMNISREYPAKRIISLILGFAIVQGLDCSNVSSISFNQLYEFVNELVSIFRSNFRGNVAILTPSSF